MLKLLKQIFLFSQILTQLKTLTFPPSGHVTSLSQSISMHLWFQISIFFIYSIGQGKTDSEKIEPFFIIVINFNETSMA